MARPSSRLIARGRDLIVVRQAGGVARRRCGVMPSARALRVIMRGEVVLVAADRFGDHHRDVVGGLGDQRLIASSTAMVWPGTQAELGGACCEA